MYYIVDVCNPNPCQNLAKCSSENSKINCVCLSQYFGTLCQYDIKTVQEVIANTSKFLLI